MKRTKGQHGCAIKGAIQKNKALSASRDGLSFAEAMARCGLSHGGLRSLLFKNFGTTTWPVNEGADQ